MVTEEQQIARIRHSDAITVSFTLMQQSRAGKVLTARQLGLEWMECQLGNLARRPASQRARVCPHARRPKLSDKQMAQAGCWLHLAVREVSRRLHPIISQTHGDPDPLGDAVPAVPPPKGREREGEAHTPASDQRAETADCLSRVLPRRVFGVAAAPLCDAGSVARC